MPLAFPYGSRRGTHPAMTSASYLTTLLGGRDGVCSTYAVLGRGVACP